jgi:uncharacterized membrane protein
MFLGGILLFINNICFGVAEIVGFILVLISLYGLADFYKNKKGIFNNALFGGLAAIIGMAVAGALMITVVLSSIEDFIYQLYPGWNGDMAALQDLTPNTANLDISAIAPFMASLLLVLVVLGVFAIIAAFFIRRSLKDLTTHSGVGTFATAGLLLLIGAVLTIPLVGILLIWIATLVLAIAFFSIKKSNPPPTTTTTTIPPSTYI